MLQLSLLGLAWEESRLEARSHSWLMKGLHRLFFCFFCKETSFIGRDCECRFIAAVAREFAEGGLVVYR